MFEQNGIPHNVPAIADALKRQATHAAAIQSAIGKKVGEINQHWFQRIQQDSNDAWQTLFKVGATPAVGDKIKLCEQWIEGTMKKAAEDAAYLLETARALGQIEMKYFTPADHHTENTPPVSPDNN